MNGSKLIVLDVVGLTKNSLRLQKLPNITKLIENGTEMPMIPSFPAVTCSVQSTLITGCNPSEHGIVANGFFERDTKQVSFWEQYSSLVQKPQIWDIIKTKKPNLKTATLFWQNSLYANSDIVLTPKPIHLDDQMIMWCYSKPVGFYEQIVEKNGEFDLRSYWGPFSSIKSSKWIIEAAKFTITQHRPDLLMIYVPHLDYTAQKNGPTSNEFATSLQELDGLVGEIVSFLETNSLTKEYGIVILSEYGFSSVNRSISPNISLRDAGLLTVRKIKDKEYIDFEHSKAFAMVDHQISHIYIKSGYEQDVHSLFKQCDGIGNILDKKAQKNLRINHSRSGEIILAADPNCWFNYHWWSEENNAPTFTFNVDIHRKPGFDPLELFFDAQKKAISHDLTLVNGSHGLVQNDENALPLVIMPDSVKTSKIHATQIAPTISKFFKIDHKFDSKPIQ